MTSCAEVVCVVLCRALTNCDYLSCLLSTGAEKVLFASTSRQNRGAGRTKWLRQKYRHFIAGKVLPAQPWSNYSEWSFFLSAANKSFLLRTACPCLSTLAYQLFASLLVFFALQVDGVDINDIDEEYYRKHLALVSQQVGVQGRSSLYVF